MRYVKNTMFIVFILIAFVSLWVNIIIVASGKTSKIEVLTKVKGIYFDQSQLEKDVVDEINSVINSNNQTLFSQLIQQKDDPIKQFYGFAGFMKSNQKEAVKYLDRLLISSKKVELFIDGKEIESNLGYSILLLLKEFPENLTNAPIDEFYIITEDAVTKAYKSNISKSNSAFKDLITSLINENYPNINNAIALNNKDSAENKNPDTKKDEKHIDSTIKQDITGKSLEEKLNISRNMSSIPSDKREKIILAFLQEEELQILSNAINGITENDSKKVALSLSNIFKKRINTEITINSIKKYALILKSDSIDEIQTFMKPITDNEKIISVCLDQIYNYGNSTSYEFLKYYLETFFSTDINIQALKTISKTTYKSNPASVLRTMAFVVGYVEKETVLVYAVRYYITNSIQENSKLIIQRLEKKDNLTIKKLAIEYISHFKKKEAKSLLEDLVNDENPEISAQAKDLLPKLD